MKVRTYVWDSVESMKYTFGNISIGMAILSFVNMGMLFYAGFLFFGIVNLLLGVFFGIIYSSMLKHTKMKDKYEKVKEKIKDGRK